MKQNKKDGMGQSAWEYVESCAVVGSIILAGILLQVTVGPFDFYLLTAPVNSIVGALLVLLSIGLGVYARRSKITRWLSGIPLSVVLIAALLLLSLIMGLTPQLIQSQTILGFDSMTSCWPFVLIYFFTLIALGTLIVRRLTCFRLPQTAFFLNHIGLWLLLTTAGLGYADMERYVMYVNEGATEWRVYDDHKNVKELPIAIRLNDFDMDVYPPRLAVINRSTGDVRPTDSPHYLPIDLDSPRGTLNGWTIELHEYLHQAVRNSDSTYHEVPMPGAVPAARIVAYNDSCRHSGWVSTGSSAQLYMALPLNEHSSVVMTAPEPRSFTSDIEVYTQSGAAKRATIEVNKPLRINSWTIYQHGYDNNAGRLSSYSSFELVYDPWIIPVYVGIILMMLGAINMVWTGKQRKKEKK